MNKKRVVGVTAVPAAVLVVVFVFVVSSGDKERSVPTDVTQPSVPTDVTQPQVTTSTSTTTAAAPATTIPATTTPAAALVALLDWLVVEPEQPAGYHRDLFRQWIDADGDGCDTRREVLIAEAVIKPTVTAVCVLSGGVWVSRFDGKAETGNGRGFDVDHLVPLKEAWSSGAYAWTPQKREQFANDLGYEHTLIAVSAASNRSKGARDPAAWLPPDATQHCWYATSWILVKARWKLSVDSLEADTLKNIISDCSPTSVTTTTGTTGDVGCHPDYSPCIPHLEGDALNCGDLTDLQKPVTVLVSGVDPYRFDRDGDGQGCLN